MGKRSSDDRERFLSRLVPFVEEDGGRNLNKISRGLRIPYQTLHKRVSALSRQGISIRPIVNPTAIGLERFRVSINIAPDITDFNPAAFFGALHQSAGLNYYARCLVSHSFDSEFLIPEGKVEELSKIFRALEEMSIVERYSIRSLLWKEAPMMKADFYDYSKGEWDVDYSKLVVDPSSYTPLVPLTQARYDEADLFIIKSLQADPWVKAVDIAEKIGLTANDVSYHMKKHVFGGHQISCFRFKWVGTKDSWAKHTIALMTYVFRSISDDSARHAMSIFTSLPFTWNHMRGSDGSYASELLIPVAHLSETLHYLAGKMRPLDLKPDEILYPDWSCSQNYTIPYSMYSNAKGWEFGAERSLGHTIQTIGAK